MKNSFLILFCSLVTLNTFSQSIKETERYLNKRDYPKARTSIVEVLKNGSSENSYYPWFLKGETYLGLFQLNLAKHKNDYSISNIQYLDTAYNAYSKSVAILRNSGKEFPLNLKISIQNCGVHYNNKGLVDYEKKHYKSALENIEKSMKVDADFNKLDSIKVYNAFAIAYSTENNLKIQFYGQCLIDSICTKKSETYAVLIQSYMLENDLSNAQDYLNKAISKFPENKNLKTLEMNLALEQKDTLKSIEMLKAILAREPNNAELAYHIANQYLKLNNSFKAVHYYSKAIVADSTFFDAYFNIASIYFNQAVKLFNAEQENKGRYNDKVETLVNDLFKKSLPYFLETHKLKPNDLQTLQSLKLIYSRLRGYDKELKQIEKLINN